jgi:hypothetical protein
MGSFSKSLGAERISKRPINLVSVFSGMREKTQRFLTTQNRDGKSNKEKPKKLMNLRKDRHISHSGKIAFDKE